MFVTYRGLLVNYAHLGIALHAPCALFGTIAISVIKHDVSQHDVHDNIGETGASCYRGRLLQGCFMQNYNIDGEIADSSCIRIHQGNH